MSSLVELAGYDGDDKPSFEQLIKKQIETLRKELGRALLLRSIIQSSVHKTPPSVAEKPPHDNTFTETLRRSIRGIKSGAPESSHRVLLDIPNQDGVNHSGSNGGGGYFSPWKGLGEGGLNIVAERLRHLSTKDRDGIPGSSKF